MTLGLSGSIRNSDDVMVELVPSMMPRLTLTLVIVRIRSFFHCARSSSALFLAERLRSESSMLTRRSEESPTFAPLSKGALKEPFSRFFLNQMN